MARILLEREPQTDDELYHLVQALWGVTIPRHKVCPDHIAPFDAFANAYFERDGSIALWHGSRGLSGKSFMLSILGITKAFIKGADVNLLGGSLAQSVNIHEHMRNAFNYQNAPKYMIETEANTQIKLNNNARIRPLTASQKTVRGPHPPFLILDEIDEMDLDILDAALGQPMPQKNYLGEILNPYTVMCMAEGTLVLTYDGEKSIEEINPGDLVLTRDGWFPVYERIDNGYRDTVNVELSNGRTLVCTPDHRVAVNGSWIEAGKLACGDMLTTVEPTQFRSPVFSGLSTDATFSSAMNRDESVVERVFVPSGAMSLRSVYSTGSSAAENIDAMGHRLQMVGVDASSDSAQMVKREVVGDIAYQHFVGETVYRTTVDGAVDHSISTGSSAIPQPATGFISGRAGQEPVTVINVSAGLTRHVYDLSVMGTPEFVAESIIVHNCSTWQNADGTFTEVLRRFQERGLPILTWCYRESANPIDGWLTQQTIDAKKMEIPAEMWRVEYELGEPSIGNRAFDTTAIDKTFSLPLEPIEQEIKQDFEKYVFEKPVGDGQYIVAADWAKEQDYTVISVIRIDRQPHTLAYYIRVNRRPYPMMINWFNQAIMEYNAEAIHDATGLGNVVNDYIDMRARKFIMTGEKRSNMLTEYVGAIERGYFTLPKIPTLFSAHKYCRTGDLYNTGKDYHLPDEVCSLALAWHAGKRYSGYGAAITVPRGNAPSRYEKNFTVPSADEGNSIYSPRTEGVVAVKYEPVDGEINLLV